MNDIFAGYRLVLQVLERLGTQIKLVGGHKINVSGVNTRVIYAEVHMNRDSRFTVWLRAG